jgi:hypothetical protein
MPSVVWPLPSVIQRASWPANIPEVMKKARMSWLEGEAVRRLLEEPRAADADGFAMRAVNLGTAVPLDGVEHWARGLLRAGPLLSTWSTPSPHPRPRLISGAVSP